MTSNESRRSTPRRKLLRPLKRPGFLPPFYLVWNYPYLRGRGLMTHSTPLMTRPSFLAGRSYVLDKDHPGKVTPLGKKVAVALEQSYFPNLLRQPSISRPRR